MFLHSKHLQRGEIATTLTLIAVVVMAAGAIIGANISRNQDVRSRAQNACGLSSKPSVTAVTSSGVTCQYTAAAVSEGYVCALVDENLPAGNQVIAGQDIPWGGTWNGTTASVPLTFKPGMSIDSSHNYTLVVYKFDQGDTCKQTQSYSGSSLANFSPGGNNPSPNNPPSNNPPQSQPTQCSNEGGSCVSSPNDCQ